VRFQGWGRMKTKSKTAKADVKGLVPKLRFPEFRNAGEWGKAILHEKDIAHIVKERTPLEELRLETYISTENILPDYTGVTVASKLPPSGSFTRFQKGDVLLSNIRPYLKKVWSADKNGASSNDVIVIRAGSKIRASFLACLLINDQFVNYVMKGAKGVKMPRGDIASIKEYPLAYPAPEEQQNVADCLSSIDALITAQVHKLDALKAHKKGLMQQLFPAPGETVPKLRFPEFRDAEEWEEFTLENVARYRRGSFPQPYGLPEWYDDDKGMPFIQVFDVSDDMRLKPSTKRKISELAAKQSVFIKKGTVIITIQGSIGRVAVTHYDAYIDRTLLLFQKFLKPIEKLFFAYTIQILFEIERQKAPGGIIKTITKEALSSFVVKLPSISEQQKIANCLSSIDDLITAQAYKLDTLKAHKKGLMQQLFPAPDKVTG